jgi:hypothetical protein
MTESENIGPQFVTQLPENATLVGKLEDKDAISLDLSLESHDVVWEQSHSWVRREFIGRAANDYKIENGEKLYLVETSATRQDDVAGIRYQVTADVYKA